MDAETVRSNLAAASARLYSEQRHLIDIEVHERTLVGLLVEYLRPLFPGWDINADYNREGNKGRPKQDHLGKLIPDIIVHTALNRDGPNLVAVEVKGHWNPQPRSLDEEKLRRLTAEYGYQHLYRIDLGPETFALVQVEVD